MGNQVARCDVRGGVFVMQPEIRQVFADRLVPLELALPHQRPERADGELLRDGSDRHLRFRRDRKLLFDIAEPVAFRVHDLVPDNDRHGRAGHLIGLQRLVNDRVDSGECVARWRLLRLESGGERRSNDKHHERSHREFDLGGEVGPSRGSARAR